MSDKVVMLAYSGYFFGCPQARLIGASKAKDTKSDLTTGFIGGVSAAYVFVWGISVIVISAENATSV